MKAKTLFGLLAFLLVALALGTTFLGILAVPVLVQTPAEAESRVHQLLDSVGRGDYASVSACMLGKPSLGVDRAPESPVGSLVWNSFTGSFRYTLQGDFYATDNGVSQDVTVQYLDMNSITTGLNERAQELVAAKVANAALPRDVYDENNEYREDVLNAVLQQAITEALEQRSRMVTAQLTLNLVYQNDQWWVVPDNALLSAISGGTL